MAPGRLVALNDTDSSEYDSDPDRPKFLTKEAQENGAFKRYNDALSLSREKKYEEAKRILIDVLKTPCLAEIKAVSLKDAHGSINPLHVLKYSCYKNLGLACSNQGDVEDAIEYTLKALELDGTDVTVWYKLGQMGLQAEDYGLASKAFQNGLEVNQNHWPCLDKLVTIQYALSDTLGCLDLIAYGLSRDPYFLKGLAIRDTIFQEAPPLKDLQTQMWKDLGVWTPYPEEEGQKFVKEAKDMLENVRKKAQVTDPPPLPLDVSIRNLSWFELGQKLLSLYSQQDQGNQMPAIKWNSPLSVEDEAMEVDEEDKKKEAEEDQEKKRPPKRKRELEQLQEWSFVKRRSNRMRMTMTSAHSRLLASQESNYAALLLKYLPLSLTQSLDKKQCERSETALHDTSLLASSADSSVINSEDSKMQGEACMEDSTVGAEVTEAQKGFSRRAIIDFMVAACAEANGNPKLAELFFQYCIHVSQLAGKWPKDLVRVFLQCYTLARRHRVPEVNGADRFHGNNEVLRSLEREAWLVLTHAELLVDSLLSKKEEHQSWARDNQGRLMDIDSYEFGDEMGIMILSMDPQEILRDACDSFGIRYTNLKAQLAMHRGSKYEALCTLRQIEDVLSENPTQVISLPNCTSFSCISMGMIRELVEELERYNNLTEIVILYEGARYGDVVELLTDPSGKRLDPLVFEHVSNDKSSEVPLPSKAHMLRILVECLGKLKAWAQLLELSHSLLSEGLKVWNGNGNGNGEGEVEVAAVAVSVCGRERDEWTEFLIFLINALATAIRECPNILDTLEKGVVGELSQNLVRLILVNLEHPEGVTHPPINSVKPWLILTNIIANEVKSEVNEKEIPLHLLLLCDAHECLSMRGWCTINNGELLLELINQLQSSSLLMSESQLRTAIEQCFYCLYSHPSKKSKVRQLVDHGCSGIALTWERAIPLYNYFRPQQLPEFDSYRVASISSDLEALYKRIASLVPRDIDPNQYLDGLLEFISGEKNELPEVPVQESNSPIIWDLYYLLGDYYLKNKEWQKAIKYYQLDICVNQFRVDSWAGLSLARTGWLETKLNSCQPIKVDGGIFEKTAMALKCFQQTVELEPSLAKMWIEYGSLAYMMHSFASKQLKQDEVVESLGLEAYQRLEEQRDDLLKRAYSCFEKARTLTEKGEAETEEGGWDESWLHFFMMSKMKAKMNPDNVSETVGLLCKAERCLWDVNAEYPQRIYYPSPQFLSLEALEVFYRIHSTILKALMGHEAGHTLDKDTLKYLNHVLKLESRGCFVAGSEKGKNGEGRAIASEILADLIDGLGKPSATFNPQGEEKQLGELKEKEEPIELPRMIHDCLAGLKMCITRFPHHYKSLYRMAYFYAHSQVYKMYMFETERKHMSKHAYDLSLQLLRNRWKEASTFTSKKAAVIDICRTHQKIMRNLGYREDILNLLTEAYINFVGKSLEKEKMESQREEALKFATQHISLGSKALKAIPNPSVKPDGTSPKRGRPRGSTKRGGIVKRPVPLDIAMPKQGDPKIQLTRIDPSLIYGLEVRASSPSSQPPPKQVKRMLPEVGGEKLHVQSLPQPPPAHATSQRPVGMPPKMIGYDHEFAKRGKPSTSLIFPRRPNLSITPVVDLRKPPAKVFKPSISVVPLPSPSISVAVRKDHDQSKGQRKNVPEMLASRQGLQCIPADLQHALQGS
ncbi:unnamed protein product [Darwinula stevensoni]|uniref:Calcineurin-binding protein cabin-1 n=1 Tax=Darwinula stevensoni TaxID=69355 RepID=A0A7R9A9B4_9CRUS|nr:unnamed protein product [Darwinula stevensoni]CAG0897136.1 unnamed protein product [Darwinula stevensoni]